MPIVDPLLREQYAKLHKCQQYGSGTSRFSLHIQACIADLKPSIILDYGCGQSNLESHLCLEHTKFHRYDPAILELSELPVSSAGLLINTDVMEHIPATDVLEVLQHMRDLSPNVFFNIATRTASQVLANGENAHCTVWPASQWLQTIRQVFPDAELVAEHPRNSCLIVTWRSSVLSLLSGIEQLKIVERQRNEYTQPLTKRLLLTTRRLLSRLKSSPTEDVVLYPATSATETPDRTLQTA